MCVCVCVHLGVFSGIDVWSESKVLQVRRLLSALLREVEHVLGSRDLHTHIHTHTHTHTHTDRHRHTRA